MTNYTLSFMDESEAIEIVIITIPDNLKKRYIFGDEPSETEIVVYPNLIMKLSKATNNVELVTEAVTLAQDSKDALSSITLTKDELIENILSNLPEDFYEKMKELNSNYELLMANIDGSEEAYNAMDKFITNFYKEINLAS